MVRGIDKDGGGGGGGGDAGGGGNAPRFFYDRLRSTWRGFRTFATALVSFISGGFVCLSVGIHRSES